MLKQLDIRRRNQSEPIYHRFLRRFGTDAYGDFGRWTDESLLAGRCSENQWQAHRQHISQPLSQLARLCCSLVELAKLGNRKGRPLWIPND